MHQHPATLGSGLRDVIGAWIVCFAVAAGCFTPLATATPGHVGRREALISPDPAATVAAAEAHRDGRC